MKHTFSEYLKATPFMDFDHPDVIAYAKKNIDSSMTDKEKAIRLYYAVRDDIRYDPYAIDLSVKGIRASTTICALRGWCVPKAILLAACCRSINIPAKLGYADVKNHLSTKRMREHMKSDIFTWHGYTLIYIQEKWVKATPAFNIELCEKFRLKPLEFDGENDSIHHAFDELGHQHMEYVRFRGEFADAPLDEITRTFYESGEFPVQSKKYDFDKDVIAEGKKKRE